MVDLRPRWPGWSGLRKELVSLAILGQDNRSLPTLRVDKENCVVLGVFMADWGVWRGPPGSQMVDLRPDGLDEVCWEKNWCHWQFGGGRTGLYLPWEWIRKIVSFWGYVWRFGGSDRGPQGPRWLIYTPMAWMKWVEKRIGVIGNFRAGGRVFTSMWA